MEELDYNDLVIRSIFVPKIIPTFNANGETGLDLTVVGKQIFILKVKNLL